MPEFGPGVRIHETAFVHATALAYGEVEVGEGASLWPNTVIRAELNRVRIGRFTNIQDFVMIHTAWDADTVVGDYCSITHHCTLHGCTIGDNCLIGINATIMDGCVIGDNCIVAGGAFLTEGTQIPDNSVVMGAPAKVKTTRNSFVANRANALAYHMNAQAYARGEHRAWSGEDFRRTAARWQQELEAEFRRLYPEG